MTHPSSAILLTGFGPFPGVTDNPTAHIAALLRDEIIADVSIHTEVLPVSFKRAPNQVSELLASSMHILATLHLGVATDSRFIRLERSAKNHIETSVGDIDGYGLHQDRVQMNRPPNEVVLSTLDVDSIAEHLCASGFDARPSDDAGAYVCNALYHHSLTHEDRPTLFMHVPPTGEQWSVLRLARATRLVLGWLVQSAPSRPTNPIQGAGQ